MVAQYLAQCSTLDVRMAESNIAAPEARACGCTVVQSRSWSRSPLHFAAPHPCALLMHFYVANRFPVLGAAARSPGQSTNQVQAQQCFWAHQSQLLFPPSPARTPPVPSEHAHLYAANILLGTSPAYRTHEIRIVQLRWFGRALLRVNEYMRPCLALRGAAQCLARRGSQALVSPRPRREIFARFERRSRPLTWA